MNKVFFGDCRESMRSLIENGVRVQCCVTSPPYYGLRDYGHPGQIGLESTPQEYVVAMVEVFRLVRDLLADDGVLWLNLGDSYTGSGKGGNPVAGKQATNAGSQTVGVLYETGKTAPEAAVTNVTRKNFDLGPKQLLGIPWRVAFALQDDGWCLRQDIIWHKPNPMPESVTDRCTKAHEYLFLLAKSERYFWDSAAMQEQAVKGAAGSAFNTGKSAEHQLGRSSDAKRVDDGMRNRRSVWTLPTVSYSGAHFATFPPALIEPCVLASSRQGDIVLDPFFGSGTTGQVAQHLGRQWIGCELNPEYESLQKDRTAQQSLLV